MTVLEQPCNKYNATSLLQVGYSNTYEHSFPVCVYASVSPPHLPMYVHNIQEHINLCFFLLSYVDKCIQQYYSYHSSDNIEQKISFAKQKCLHIVKSNKDTWLRLWFNSTAHKKMSSVPLVVILKDTWGKERRKWNLSSENVRNFLTEEKGDWFEIQEPRSGNYYWFHLNFKLYSAGKTNTIYVLLFVHVNDASNLTSVVNNTTIKH